MGPDRNMTEAQWQAQKVGRVSMTAQGYGQMRLFIEEACRINEHCDVRLVRERLKSFKGRIK